eukprot:3540240-Alexandrium_andersonii.AAC.1
MASSSHSWERDWEENQAGSVAGWNSEDSEEEEDPDLATGEDAGEMLMDYIFDLHYGGRLSAKA